MRLDRKILKYIDWHLFILYVIIIYIGIVAIYSVGYSQAITSNFLGISSRTIKQILWFSISLINFFIIINIDSRYFQSLSYIIYFAVLIFIVGTFILGKKLGGHNSWYQLKIISLQPSEFAKISTSFAIAKFLQKSKKKLNNFKDVFFACIIIGIPMFLILLQGDLGSSIVFTSFIIVGYREGLSTKIIFNLLKVTLIAILALFVSKVYLIIALIIISLVIIGINISKFFLVLSNLIIGLSIILTVDLAIYKFLKPHQFNRIKALVNPKVDPKGISWNVTQAKIAIGSGGLIGKGFLKGTQTKFGFVPQQETDFIFCTIGEEYGFLGSMLVILLFIMLLNRILVLSERQKTKYERIYGYSIFSIITFHFIINIGMTLGIMPIIGIPLPYITYGGSALFSFSLMIFILLKMDADRTNYISKKSSLM